MKLFNILALFLLFPHSGQSQSLPEKPFQRAIVLSGDSINTAFHLGMVDGAALAGKPADIVIATCGGSIAASLLAIFPSEEERINFLLSREYYESLRQIRFEQFSYSPIGRARSESELLLAGADPFVPSIYQHGVIRGVENLFSGFENFSRGFEANSKRIIVIGGRLAFNPAERAGARLARGEKFIREVFFTDTDTARFLQNVASFAGSIFPNSFLQSETSVVTDYSLREAMLASIADPLLFSPIFVRGEYYTSGVINMDPYNVATKLANETIGRVQPLFGSMFVNRVLSAGFGFDSNHARAIAMNNPDVDYWVDTSSGGYPEMERDIGVGFFSAIWNGTPGKFLTINLGVPETYQAYVELVRRQWQAGKNLVAMALRNPPRSQGHIRSRIPLRRIDSN